MLVFKKYILRRIVLHKLYLNYGYKHIHFQLIRNSI